MRLAWPNATQAKPRFDPAKLETVATLEELFSLCEKPEADDARSARYTLRLGNHRYPFMKFVVQEYLVDREYFFSVDTHDDHVMSPGDPEWDQWCQLKDFNRELKRDIEGEWAKEELQRSRRKRPLVLREAC